MKHLLKILIYTLLMPVSVSYGQATSYCDTIYNTFETIPQYDKDFKGLTSYLINELAPIIGDCMERDSTIIASLFIILTIDSQGKVVDAAFSRPNLTAICKTDLKKKLLTMNGWTAGQVNGQPVCRIFNWPIRCLKWE
ncbi:MAG: hypothetical protein Q7T20_02180 [Saprospiraceae bacterium]|nr:hypothetical protein [Saprospiraceae bacterium]